MLSALDSFYNSYPEYKLPEKWKEYDNWDARGYNFMDSRIFYFRGSPEEMYYVTLRGNKSAASEEPAAIAIRAVSKGTGKWLLQEDFKRIEIERIESRFEAEILSKLKCDYQK